MHSAFKIFGPIHLAILGSIPLLAAILAGIHRRFPRGSKSLRIWLALVLLLNSILLYGYMAMRGWLKFPDSLPLELCDATLCLTLFALLTLNKMIFELAYYFALAGTSMALLTPDLSEPFPSFSTSEFFITHGLVVVSLLYLVWSRELRLQTGSILRAMIGVNIFAAVVGTFDLIFKTNSEPSHQILRFSISLALGPGTS
jgi:hypothetical integral membrane protein (TIGR02206 family)